MRRTIATLAAVFVIGIGSQAQAAILQDWTLNTTGIGGTEVVQHIDSIGMNGVIDLVQNIADGSGVPKVGDTFTISNASNAADPIAFKGVSYNSGANIESPLLSTGALTLETPQLTGQITATSSPGVYDFSYNSPGPDSFKLVYTDAANTRHVIASFNLDVATSGGYSSGAPISSTGLLTGLSSLSGEMNVLLAGVLFDSAGNDLAGATYPVQFAALSGGYNYQATGTANAITVNNGSSNSNFTIAAVPEPSSMLLLGSGVLGASFLKRKNRKNKAAA